jgi:hypothetical protein
MLLSRTERAHLALARRIPFWAHQRPEAAWFALACLLSGVPILAGVVRPGSVADLLHPALTRAWGAVLVLGAVATVSGLTSIRLGDGGVLMTRPSVYKLGTRLLMLGALVYGVSIIWVAGWRGVAAASMILAFSLAQFLRLNQMVTAEISERHHG